MRVICEKYEECECTIDNDNFCWQIVPHIYTEYCHGSCDEHGETKCMEIILKEVNGGKNGQTKI